MAILSGAQAETELSSAEGYHTVTPAIVVQDVAALMDYLKTAFDAEEVARAADADGGISHAEIKIGDSIVMLLAAGENRVAAPGFFHVYVEDGDAAYHRAIAAGGKSAKENPSFGDHMGQVSDPAGNIWWIQTRDQGVEPDAMNQPVETPASADDGTATLVAAP